ncbi:ANTAR domain-containing protein [Pleomorphomonas sp. JP5]|uniref:ANTAR domain-containing protein n=1 Tax=Pleomorphomonas sp. JP5 TaxID=2942998 RepID=UPI0020430C12|nr:ANTAR domain-containing protein [Pleomorphomonas sp. JP5]MCM5557702.1 ANTAR domain-containing protein [Pleomorphomonas sp. JP5]
MTVIPDLVGLKVAILHRLDEGIGRLVRQLGLLGLEAHVQWTPLDLEATPADIVLVDADQGWSGLLPWSGEPAPVPMVALLQSEAPGRVAWAISEGALSILPKPVVPAAVYPALVLAVAAHARAVEAAARMERLEERLRMRPLVHAAVRSIEMAVHCDEEAAYAALRRAAMKRRITIEQTAAEMLAGVIPLSEAG